MKTHWSVRAALGYGVGFFEGHSGDNLLHKHLAHQITFAAKAAKTIYINDEQNNQLEGLGFFISADTLHQLPQDHYFSIYLDSTHTLAQVIIKEFNFKKGICELPINLIDICRQYFQNTNKFETNFYNFQNNLLNINNVDINISTKKQLLQHYLLQHRHFPTKRQQLAQYLNLSESRFSHWFKEEFNISYRSYLKWLKLLNAIRYIQQNHSLTESALLSDFSDQAHFNRTCLEMFGLIPSLIKKNISELEILEPQF